MRTKTEKMRAEAEELERLKEIAKAGYITLTHKLNPKEKKILSQFGEISSFDLSKQVKVNRSYIYAVIYRFRNLLKREACSKCLYKRHCEVL